MAGQYSAVVKSEGVVRSGLTRQQYVNYVSSLRSSVRRDVSMVLTSSIPPTPIPTDGGFQVYTIDRGGGRTPQTLSTVKTFGTRAEAERFAKYERIEFTTRDTPVGIRPTPTKEQEAAFERHHGRQVTGPAPKGRATTRTPEEQARIEQKHATLTLKNIAAGKSHASKATIERLQQTAGREISQQTQHQKVKVAYGGPTKNATPAQIVQAKKEGSAYYIDGKKTTPGAREVGYTESGGTYNIPEEAVYHPGFSHKLKQPTGKEKANVIIKGYREQIIDIKSLPEGSVVKTSKGQFPVSQLQQEKIDPSISSLRSKAAAVMKKEKELKRKATLQIENELGIVSRTGRDVVGDISNLQNNKVGFFKNIQQNYDKKTHSTIEGFQKAGESFTQLPPSDQNKFAGAYYSLGYLGSKAFRGATGLFVHPVESIKGLFKAETYKNVYHGFKTDPFGTAAELGGSFLGAKTIGKGIKSSPVKPTIGKLKLPTAEGSKVFYRGVGVKIKSNAHPLVGVTEGKLTLLNPKIDLTKADFSKGYLPETAMQTKIIQKNIPNIYPKSETLKLKYGLDVMKATETTKSKFITKKFITESKTLNPEGTRTVIEFAKQEKADVYGSFGARQQMPADLARKPADIDIQLGYGVEKAAIKTKELVIILKSKGENVRVSEKSPTLIEAKGKGGEWHHAVDIHTKDDLLISSPAAKGGTSYGLKLGQNTINIEKTKVMPLSEQGIRKGSSTLTMREKGFAPEAHRLKDIPDFIATQEALLRSKSISNIKAESSLKKFKSLYPAELTTKAGESKVLIMSPRDIPSIPRRVSMPMRILIKPKSVKLPREKSEYTSKYSSSRSIHQSSKSSQRIQFVSINKKVSPPQKKSSAAFKNSGRSISPAPSRSIRTFFSPPSLLRSPSRSLPGSPSPSPSRPYSPPRKSSPYSPPYKPPNKITPTSIFSLPKLRRTTKPKITEEETLFGRQPKGYTPSFGALIGNIRGKREPKALTKSDLGIRPILKKHRGAKNGIF